MKRFLTQLQPVDFGAIAKRGCFVYCYLRADGSPYYVGVASRADRPLCVKGRNVPPPRDRARIRVFRAGLSREQALHWECFYIARYGRKDIGTGILRNLTAGGDGLVEASTATRDKISQANLARDPASFAKDEQWKRKVRRANTSADAAARYGFSFEEWLALPTSEKAKIRNCHRSAQRRAERLGTEAMVLTGGCARAAYAHAEMAARYGVTPSAWASLTRVQKAKVHARYKKLGKRGAELFAGLEVAL